MLTQLPDSSVSRPPTAIGNSAAWRRVTALAKKMAPLQMPVLITGESGVGKEVIAQILHHWSNRERADFVPLNCSLLQDQLLESELFGHKRGAYTGAADDAEGLFGVASGGTLFLDEIGELSANCQAKLLRVLESGEYRPLGDTRVCHTGARVIAATHRDLEKMISQGRFRQDLYYRLNVLTIEIPPLNQRPEDIPLLVDHFLEQDPQRETPALAPEAMDQLQAYHWPGNVRELKNVVERLRVHCDDGIDAAQVESVLARQRGHGEEGLLARFNRIGSLAVMEKAYAEWVLEQCSGNVSQAAKALQVSRTTLYRILRMPPGE